MAAGAASAAPATCPATDEIEATRTEIVAQLRKREARIEMRLEQFERRVDALLRRLSDR